MSSARLPGLRRLEPRVHALQHRRLGVEEGLRRLAQEHRARQRAVIAVIGPGELEEGALARLHRRIVPGQVRRRRLGPGWQQRHDRGIVAARADLRVVAQAGVEDLRHQVALAQARLDHVDDALVHPLHEPRRRAHVGELLLRLHRPLPVHQPLGVLKRRVRQVALQRGVGGRREPVIVHLDGDPRLVPAALDDPFRQEVHRMAHLGLHVVVRVADDVRLAHEAAPACAIGVLAPAEPDRIAVQRQQHRLVHVERPPVVAGQPGHVGRVRADHQLDPARLHRPAHLGDARGVLGPCEMQRRFGHARRAPPKASSSRFRSRLRRPSRVGAPAWR